MPLQATPEGPKSFLDDQWQVRDYVAFSIRLLFQFHSDGRFSRNYAMSRKRTLYLPRMNASNDLRRAVSSLTREEKGFSSAIAARDKLQFLFRVLAGCGGQVQRGRFSVGRQSACSTTFVLILVLFNPPPPVDYTAIPVFRASKWSET